jgi:hypothetical protein
VSASGATSGFGILPSGAPVVGSVQEVTGRGDLEPVFFIGACGGPVGPGGGAGLLLLATAFLWFRATCKGIGRF